MLELFLVAVLYSRIPETYSIPSIVTVTTIHPGLTVSGTVTTKIVFVSTVNPASTGSPMNTPLGVNITGLTVAVGCFPVPDHPGDGTLTVISFADLRVLTS